jgi:hypothetical protein
MSRGQALGVTASVQRENDKMQLNSQRQNVSIQCFVIFKNGKTEKHCTSNGKSMAL